MSINPPRRTLGSSVAVAYLLVLGLFSSTIQGQPLCHPWDDSITDRNRNLLIGAVNIEAGSVFDFSNKRESGLLHKFANNMHNNTRENVILRQLLFRPGDQFDANLLAETERLLRKNSYISSALVRPHQLCGNQITINVKTTDNWSFAPGISFGREGGANRSSYALKESNLFGLGKTLQLKFAQGPDRDEQVLRYNDPQLFGSRQQLNASLQNNSDGHGFTFNLSQPYFSNSTTRAWHFSAASKELIQTTYQHGAKIDKQFGLSDTELDIGFGKAHQRDNGDVWRLGAGWNYKDISFASNVEKPLTEPSFRTFSFPYVSVEYEQARYVTRTNFRSMERIEDIAVGNKFHSSIGYSSSSFGASENALVFSANYTKTLMFGTDAERAENLSHSRHVGELEIDYQITRFESQRSSGELELSANWFSVLSPRSTIYLGAKFALSDSLYAENQLSLGGEHGMRGYPLHYQNGDQSFLLTAEQRFYFDWYPFRLARFGAAVFFDIGSTQDTSGAADRQSDNSILRDVGFGIRLVPTRHSEGGVLHMDLAFPLDGDDSLSSVQLLLKTKKAF